MTIIYPVLKFTVLAGFYVFAIGISFMLRADRISQIGADKARLEWTIIPFVVFCCMALETFMFGFPSALIAQAVLLLLLTLSIIHFLHRFDRLSLTQVELCKRAIVLGIGITVFSLIPLAIIAQTLKDARLV